MLSRADLLLGYFLALARTNAAASLLRAAAASAADGVARRRDRGISLCNASGRSVCVELSTTSYVVRLSSFQLAIQAA